MHVLQGIEKRDTYIQVRRPVRCKLMPLLLHLDVREIGAAKRLGSTQKPISHLHLSTLHGRPLGLTANRLTASLIAFNSNAAPKRPDLLA